MNKNIDLTKILKNCPKGWNLYSSIYGKVTFLRIEDGANYPIEFSSINKEGVKRCGSVTKEGIHNTSYNGECTLFPSETQRDWNKFTAPWIKKDKFDPGTLHLGDMVLVKDNDSWDISLFAFYNEMDRECICSAFRSYKYCIPYNDETKHLAGTAEEASEYYRYWED